MIMRLGSGKCMNIMTGNLEYYIRRKLKFDARKFCVTSGGGRDTKKRKLGSLRNAPVCKRDTTGTDHCGNRRQTHQGMKQRMCGTQFMWDGTQGDRHVARDYLTLEDGTDRCSRTSVTRYPHMQC
jgi:hypothetical protein